MCPSAKIAPACSPTLILKRSKRRVGVRSLKADVCSFAASFEFWLRPGVGRYACRRETFGRRVGVIDPLPLPPASCPPTLYCANVEEITELLPGVFCYSCLETSTRPSLPPSPPSLPVFLALFSNRSLFSLESVPEMDLQPLFLLLL